MDQSLLPEKDNLISHVILYKQDNINDPSGFRARARTHQSLFRENFLKVPCIDLYGTKIASEDGHEYLLNFYPLKWVHDAAKSKYPAPNNNVYCDLLRSEHIPLNFFAPFVFAENRDLLKRVLNSYMSGTIKSLENVLIEHAPSPKKAYLNDLTSFDVYIEYIHAEDNSVGIIGIEVKYTERDYKLKPLSKEARCVSDTNSIYWQVTRRSQLYKPECYPMLKTDRYRQVWRNQLLGESMLQEKPNKWKHSTLIMFHPEGNTHIGNVSKDYQDLFLPNNELKFIPITYQSFLEQIEIENANNENEIYLWHGWCLERYIHP